MLVFISGGVRSGKSSLGEKLAVSLAGANRKIYLATARHYDEEITKRIQIHQQNRKDKGFLTLDKSSAIGEVEPLLEPKDTVMLDCLGTLLANEMFEESSYSEPSRTVLIRNKILTDLLRIQNRVTNLIVISNEVFADGVRYDKAIEAYIRTLAELHIKLAQASDTAIECVYSGYQCYKGRVVF